MDKIIYWAILVGGDGSVRPGRAFAKDPLMTAVFSVWRK
jgi:hypothetical protein